MSYVKMLAKLIVVYVSITVNKLSIFFAVNSISTVGNRAEIGEVSALSIG